MKTKQQLFGIFTITTTVLMMLLVNRCQAQPWVGSDNFSSGISTSLWTIYQTNHGSMTVEATNGHASFLVPTSADSEQNAELVWNQMPPVSDDWSITISGHNSASWSTNGSSQLQLGVVDSSGAKNAFLISMDRGANSQFGTAFFPFSVGDGPVRQSALATNTDFGLRIVHTGGVNGDLEAWYDPDGSGTAWTLLDTISMAAVWPGVVASNTFLVGIVSDTYFGPVTEGHIFAGNFQIINTTSQPGSLQTTTKLNIELNATIQLPNQINTADTNIIKVVTKSAKFNSASILDLIAVGLGNSFPAGTYLAQSNGIVEAVTKQGQTTNLSAYITINNISGGTVLSGSANSATGKQNESGLIYSVIKFNDGNGNTFGVDGLIRETFSQSATNSGQDQTVTDVFSGTVVGYGTVAEGNGNTNTAVFSGTISGGR